MIGAPNTQGQKYWVGIVQWAPETSVSEKIADIFRNYDINAGMFVLPDSNNVHVYYWSPVPKSREAYNMIAEINFRARICIAMVSHGSLFTSL